MSTEILAGLVGLLLGGGAVWLGLQRRSGRAAGLQAQLKERSAELERGRAETEQLRQGLQQSQIAQARLEEQARVDKEKLGWLEQAEKQIRQLSDKVLSEQREAMTKKGQEAFSDTLKPFGEQMKEFRQRIDSLNQNTTKERSELQTMVKSLSERTGQISSEAHELTQALKGDSQMRGEWGEIALQRVLEMSGLEEGREYQMQQSFSTAGEEGNDGRRLRPDVIVRLPDERDIVIDAKLALNDWIAASAADDEAVQEAAIKQFIAAVRAQISNLASKEYHNIPDIRTLDFTLMYIPLEPAYACVLQREPGLVSDAFKKHIALVSPTTLLPVLRIVENIWRLDRQNKNSQTIADEAGKMYDKLVIFLESLEKIGKGLEGAQRSYDDAVKQLKDGRGNLIGRAEKVKALGANAGKSLPASMTEGALPDNSDE